MSDSLPKMTVSVMIEVPPEVAEHLCRYFKDSHDPMLMTSIWIRRSIRGAAALAFEDFLKEIR